MTKLVFIVLMYYILVYYLVYMSAMMLMSMYPLKGYIDFFCHLLAFCIVILSFYAYESEDNDKGGPFTS